MTKRCWVYWIHLEEHTDITTEGYVGITTLGVEERFKRHLSAARASSGRNQRIVHCIRKYADRVKVRTLLEGTLEYCQMVENKLRPAENIGWNLSIGGAATATGRKNSPEHVRKVAEANRGKKHKPEHVAAMREGLKKRYTFANPWEHPYANRDVWARAADVAEWFENTVERFGQAGRRKAAKDLNLPADSVDKPLQKIKSGWNPLEDEAWLTFRDKYLKEAHADSYAT